MGNVNMEAYQVHFEGKSVAEKLKELDAIAQQIEDLPTFTSNDRVFLEAVPEMPTEEGKTVLTATTDGQGNTELTYETPDVEGSDIAPVFDDTAAYSEGDLVYYDGALYKFDADHAAGTWDPTEATQTSVAAEFNKLKNTLSIHTVSGTTPAQLATAFNKLTTLQKNTSKVYVHTTDGSGGMLPCLYSKHYEIMYFDSNTISDIQLDISNSSATLIKAVYTFGSSTRTNTTLTIDNWTIYYFGDPIS